MLGIARVQIKGPAGAEIETDIVVMKGEAEPLLGMHNSLLLGIVKINLHGENQSVVRRTREKFVKPAGAKIGLEDEPVTQNVQRIISGWNLATLMYCMRNWVYYTIVAMLTICQVTCITITGHYIVHKIFIKL